MKKYLFLCLLFVASPTFAQSYTPANYQGEKQELREMFQSLWSDYKTLDNFHCYRRAHIIAHQMVKKNILPVKAFFFTGDKAKNDLGWWYHVAPMVYYKSEGVVVDRGLLPGATHLKDWYMALSGGSECKEIFSMNEYRQFKPTTACMYFIAPMYYYTPLTLEEIGRTKFVQEELQDMLFALNRGKRDDYLRKYPIE